MRGSATALLVILLIWIGGSAWWYTCKIKQNCVSFSANSKSVSSILVLQLEGEDPQTFHLKNSENGIMEFLPGSNGDGLSVIKKYLNEHPDQNIDLITANESQANGLMAMMILSGVSNRRINAYTDATLGSAEKPLRIVSSKAPETELPTIADTDTIISDSVEVVIEEPVVEKTPKVNPPVYAATPCPKVDTNGEQPTIEDLLYPSASFNVRCTARLRSFVAASMTALEKDESIKLVITGHTDDNQNQTNNYQLALKRAVEVKKYLIKQGIPGHRIETYSKGADAPVADNSSPEGQQSNRRVSIRWE